MTQPVHKFPRSLLQALTVEWNIASGSTTPGQSGAGAFNFQSTAGGGLWIAKMNLIRLMTRDNVAAYRAFRIIADGGVGMLEIPREDILQPWMVNGVEAGPYPPIPHSDGAYFSDGSGYYQPYIRAWSVGGAAQGATSMTVRFDRGGPLRGGEPFSIKHTTQHWRHYEIGKVLIDGDGYSEINFRPRLREAIVDATRIEFERTRCVMRLFSADSMNFTLETKPLPRPTATFVETFFPV